MMGQWKYEAVEANGARRSGVMEADGEKAARQALRAQGLVPLALSEAAAGEKGWQGAGAFDSASLCVWTRQMAELVVAGLPLERSLAHLSESAATPAQQRIGLLLLEQVRQGQSFSRALMGFPGAFDEVYCAVVAASEEGGGLGAALDGLASQRESAQELRSKMVSAALYPGIVSLFSFAIVLFLISYVVPQVANVFAHQKKALPALTVGMLWISEALRSHGIALAAFGGAGAWLGKMFFSSGAPRLAFDRWFLKLPIAGELSKEYSAARYGMTLAMLARSGVPIVKALEAAAKTLSNKAMRAQADSISAMVGQGAPLGACLAQMDCFPKLLGTFAKLGEQTGALGEMLWRASEQLSKEAQRKALRLSTLLEPLLIVGMGVAVMLIVAAVLLPIVGMSALAR